MASSLLHNSAEESLGVSFPSKSDPLIVSGMDSERLHDPLTVSRKISCDPLAVYDDSLMTTGIDSKRNKLESVESNKTALEVCDPEIIVKPYVRKRKTNTT